MEQLVSFTGVITAFAVVLISIYWIHTFVVLYHLIRFGIGTRPKQVSLFFFLGSSGLFFLLSISMLLIMFFQI